MVRPTFINQRFNRDTDTLDVPDSHECEPDCRGAFSNYTLSHLCDNPDDHDGDEYILINGKLWSLELLLVHGWSYNNVRKLPRVLIKPETEVSNA